MTYVQERIEDGRRFLKTLSLFSRPVFFQIIMGLTVLYADRVYLDFIKYGTTNTSLSAAFKAVVFILQHRSVPVVITFYLIWLTHWFYFWRKLDENIYSISLHGVRSVVLFVTGFVFILLGVFSWIFQPDISDTDNVALRHYVLLIVGAITGSLFPFILLGNLWFVLQETYEIASHEIFAMAIGERNAAQSLQQMKEEAIKPAGIPLAVPQSAKNVSPEGTMFP